MPHSKSAQKQVRACKKRVLRNKSIHSLCKTNITGAEKLIFSGELKPGQLAVTRALSSLDEAVQKGALHSNNAARRKSRLVNKLNRALASAATEGSPKPENNPE